MSLPQEQFNAQNDHMVKLHGRLGSTAPTSTTSVSAGRVALEIREALETRRSMRASRAPVSGQASARLALAARSAAPLPLLPPPLRPCPLWPCFGFVPILD